MTLPWHTKDPLLLTQLKVELGTKYPDLTLIVEGDTVYLKGTFPIIHNDIELDRFGIEIEVPNTFPKDVPIVRETAGRIPYVADWHAFTNGVLCIVVPEEWLLNAEAGSIIAFLDGPVRNFLLNHALAERGMARPMGERQHGSKGLLDAYGELVGSTVPHSTEKYLDYLTAKKLKSHWKCPCGSEKQIRHCHMLHLTTLRKTIPRWIAERALIRLRNQIRRESPGQNLDSVK